MIGSMMANEEGLILGWTMQQARFCKLRSLLIVPDSGALKYFTFSMFKYGLINQKYVLAKMLAAINVHVFVY